jgi:hypothetical protein
VLPLTVGIRDSVVQLVSTLGSAVISARAELGSIACGYHTLLQHLTYIQHNGGRAR